MALSALQEKVLYLKMTTMLNQKQIAEQLGINDETVSQYNKDPEYQAAIRERIGDKFGELAIKAQEKMATLLESDSDKVSLQAAKHILDFGGYAPVQKQQIDERQISIVIKPEE
jgi:predicted transcriptional regulator